jgi:hypothetical protein
LPYSRFSAEELVPSEQETEQYGLEGSFEEAEKPELLFEGQEMWTDPTKSSGVQIVYEVVRRLLQAVAAEHAYGSG